MRSILKRLFLVFPVLLLAGVALAASGNKDSRFSDQDYSNDLMLDGMNYREFLNRCNSEKSFCIKEINFITFKFSNGRFACDYNPKDLETVSMGVVTLMKIMLNKSPDVAAHHGDTLRGDVIGAIDYLGKTCAERLKNAGG